MKDTAGNLEVLCRLLSDIFAEFGRLPLGLHLQQDNTSRECKNQKVLQFAIMLVAKGVFRWVSLSYLITGHTHTGLGATFGQLAVKLSLSEFSTDTEVVDLLARFAQAWIGQVRRPLSATSSTRLPPGASGPRVWGSTSTTSRGPMHRTTSASG